MMEILTSLFWFYTWKLYIHDLMLLYIFYYFVLLFIIIHYHYYVFLLLNNNYSYCYIIIYIYICHQSESQSHVCQWFEDQNTWVVVGDYPSAVFGSCFRIFMWDSPKKYLADEIADAFSKMLRVKGWFEKGKMSGHETGHLRYSFDTFWYRNCSML